MITRPSRYLAATLLLVGCNPFGHPAEDGRVELGTFRVEAAATSNQCGEGALGMTSSWAFDVALYRAPGRLQWDNGRDIVEGEIAQDDQTFAFEVAVDVDMRTEADPSWLPPCSIRRTDRAEGVLSSTTSDVEGFEAKFRYAFEPTAGSDCSDLYGPEGPMFLRLPCIVEYEAKGVRTNAPDAED